MHQGAMKNLVEEYFHRGDIILDGSNPWDIQILDDRFYQKVIMQGTLGFGEAYMDGWWDVQSLDEMIFRFLRFNPEQNLKLSHQQMWHWLQSCLLNLQSKSRALIVGEKHYDIGNELFKRMLDKRMTYSCGYWKEANNLDAAQEAKLELICKKIGLAPGMKVLDIGCGWGSFAKYAAEKYNVEVVGITISKKQLELAQVLCKGLPITLRLQDYRDINEPFDRIVSVGQMEHVGYKNYPTYFDVILKCLKDDGIFLLHTIGNNYSVRNVDPWLEKYIFPNGMLPSIKQLASAFEKKFVMEDWHNFGNDYDKTLMAWYVNFHSSWNEIKTDYDEKFYRMWKYYLLTCAGAFRARSIQLWQIVLTKKGILGGYHRPHTFFSP
ncbi:MAG: cyclopropane fatty acyl phospholipid synthase [Parachlamydiaceae bacterium]|nr:cyclopropane fatty acyl phospholipid synthase [Parachlamydiaceae bacterium]